MISYWVDRPSRFGIDDYLATRGAPVVDRFVVRLYEDLETCVQVPTGGHIFTALDRVTPAGVALATELCDRIAEAAPAAPRLNDPRRVLRRGPLLHALAAAGLNDFRAWPADGPLGTVRFPAFVRMANCHTGSLTELLDSPAALRQALRALQFRGTRRQDLLVVEYLHTADEQGRFRKYSAYRVGGTMVRTHMFCGHAWSLKSARDEADVAAVREMHDYVTGNQHEAWLWQVFELAGIGFGRADYALANGRPQLWEINLTPTMCRAPGAPAREAAPEVKAIRAEARAFAHARLREALAALDRSGPPLQASVQLPAALIDRFRAERQSAARRQAVLVTLSRLFTSRPLRWPVRALYGRKLPRR